MLINDKHIILLGFKHVGKTAIGQALAQECQRQFIDLDEQIEKNYASQQSKSLSCRQIMQQEGEEFFRQLEQTTLQTVLNSSAAIIALGGGTPLLPANQRLLAPHTLIHITAPSELVFKRIMAHGLPAFFPAESDPLTFFLELWKQREPVYRRLTSQVVNNSGTIEAAVKKIKETCMASKKILLLHGANLNFLGKRDPAHYGHLTLQDLEILTSNCAKSAGYAVCAYQSNHEGDLIDILQVKASECAGIIINPGAFTHYSYALYDALLDTKLPIIEVHLSDIHAREAWRNQSVTAPAAYKVIWGKKELGYQEAVSILVEVIGR